MKTQFKILLVLLSVALNVAFVGGWLTRILRGAESEGRAAGGIPVLYRQLGTSEEQWQQLRPAFEKFRESALGVFQRVSQGRQGLLALLADPKSDRTKIAAKQKEIRAAQAEMQDLVIAHVLAERELLTPKQREKYFELLANRSGMLCENLMEGLRSAGSHRDGHTGVPSQ